MQLNTLPPEPFLKRKRALLSTFSSNAKNSGNVLPKDLGFGNFSNLVLLWIFRNSIKSFFKRQQNYNSIINNKISRASHIFSLSKNLSKNCHWVFFILFWNVYYRSFFVTFKQKKKSIATRNKSTLYVSSQRAVVQFKGLKKQKNNFFQNSLPYLATLKGLKLSELQNKFGSFYTKQGPLLFYIALCSLELNAFQRNTNITDRALWGLNRAVYSFSNYFSKILYF